MKYIVILGLAIAAYFIYREVLHENVDDSADPDYLDFQKPFPKPLGPVCVRGINQPH